MNPAYRLLLLSSSRTAGSGFLEHARNDIRQFLDGRVRRAVFLPYAAVSVSYDDYLERVRPWFAQFDCAVSGLHRAADIAQALSDADLIVVGGGNTFRLLHELYRYELLDRIRERLAGGASYLGWSAGSNVACPSIRTTNDMPIIWPPLCDALHLVPFQINPHYTDQHPPGHQGETRAERIAEFTTLNPGMLVVGLREGSALRVENGKVHLLGPHAARIARGANSWDVAPGDCIETGLRPDDEKQ
ncbi:MAG TPA: dipeptidase PepE [Gammaproteobacteria bacterium]|nr:dipeptidase PepE [Gammaproteobacteria bacterium]